MANLDDELYDFLSHFHFIYPNLNDTFVYACADSEKIYIDADPTDGEEFEGSNTHMLVEMYRKYGGAGINAVCSKIRGREVIEPLRTERYLAAMEELKDWEYWDD